jgi:hypothetical protein
MLERNLGQAIVSCWGLLAELDLFLHLHQSAILFSYVVCLAAFEFLLEMFKHHKNR